MTQVMAERRVSAAPADYIYATVEASTEPLPEGWEPDLDAGVNGLEIVGGVIVAAHYRRLRNYVAAN